MGRGSVRQNKNKFQLIREDLGLSREKAAELLETVSPERIEKIESGKCAPYPEEVLAFARKYKRPSLCNYYCSQCCPIGKAYVPEVEMKELSAIVLEMLASLNAVDKRKDRLIEITADGNSVRNSADLYPHRRYHFRKIHRSRFALNGRIRRHDDLLHAAVFEPLQKLADTDIVGSHVIERRNDAVQHMVHAVVFPGALHGDNILWLRHDADETVVTLLILADGADVTVRQVLAYGAQVDGPPRLKQGVGKFLRLILRLGQ